MSDHLTDKGSLITSDLLSDNEQFSKKTKSFCAHCVVDTIDETRYHASAKVMSYEELDKFLAKKKKKELANQSTNAQSSIASINSNFTRSADDRLNRQK